MIHSRESTLKIIYRLIKNRLIIQSCHLLRPSAGSQRSGPAGARRQGAVHPGVRRAGRGQRGRQSQGARGFRGPGEGVGGRGSRRSENGQGASCFRAVS